MTDLIRNCAHYSTHQTLIDQSAGASQSRTIKTTFSRDGVAGIQAEYDGLTWYASRLGRDISEMVLQFRMTPGYARLETRYVDGTVIGMPTNPDELPKKIDAALEYYIKYIWDGPDTPSHGDFSLSNHVFNDDDDVIQIIDWEHFNHRLPPQYDPLYMIVEPFLFWHVNDKTANAESIFVAKSRISTLKEDIALTDDAARAPASWLRYIAGQNTDTWGEQAHKVPFLDAYEHQVKKIDQLLGNTLVYEQQYRSSS